MKVMAHRAESGERDGSIPSHVLVHTPLDQHPLLATFNKHYVPTTTDVSRLATACSPPAT